MSCAELEHESTLRKRISTRIARRLLPVYDLLASIESEDSLRQSSQNIITRLRLTTSQLSGVSVTDESAFQETLSAWIDHQTCGGLHISWRKIGPWPQWTEQEYLDAFLILSEACSNARRHGQASEIRILVQSWPEGFTVTVEDNGSGFPNMSGESDDGAGLTTMKLRALRSGATFFSTNQEDGGSLVGWSRDTQAPVDKNPLPKVALGKRLGMELHDNLCQHLVALMVELELLREKIPEKESEDWLHLKEAADRLRKAQHEFRAWSHELIESNQLSSL